MCVQFTLNKLLNKSKNKTIAIEKPTQSRKTNNKNLKFLKEKLQQHFKYKTGIILMKHKQL